MSDYCAPLKDIGFAIRIFGSIDEIARLPGCDEVSAELIDEVIGEAGKFAAEVLSPLNRTGDRQGAQLVAGNVRAPDGFRDAYRRFVEGGWNGLAASPRFGGQGLPQLVAIPVQEMWVSANMAFSLAPMLTCGVLEALHRYATEQQQNLYLPRLTRGEWTGTMNLTEPQAGSDLSAVNTRAVREGDHYRIQGTKIFITWGEHDMSDNIIHLVLARTPEAPPGVKGISLFIVPRFLGKEHASPNGHNDVQCISIEKKLGIHASPTCVLSYGEKAGAIGYLVGEENRGLAYMFTVMNYERLGASIQGVGIAERAFQQALEYAKTRIQGRDIGRKIGDRVAIINHPDVRRMLMSMKAQVEAMRALAYFAAATLDKSQRHSDPQERRRFQALIDLLTPIVKGWCTEQAVEIASTGIQIHGGMGFIEESGAAQYLRDARITTIYEGTTGIQAGDLIGRKVALDEGKTALALFSDMRDTCAALVDTGSASEKMRLSLHEAIDALERATRWIIAEYAQDPNNAAAVSVPYLKLFGTVTGGWLMSRSFLAACAQLTAAEPDRDFLEAKLATARFYADHLLPHASALATVIMQGAGSVLALGVTLF